jgi:Putative lumazine-binding
VNAGRTVVRSLNNGSRWSADDEAAISLAVHDYMEGWFEGDPARMERALHPGLAKRSPVSDGEMESLDTDSARSMIDATAKGIGTRHEPHRRGFQVEVTDVHKTIANVTVYSDIYREYLGLVRTRDGWKIANALWQFVDDDAQRGVGHG